MAQKTNSRLNVMVNNELMKAALKFSGLKTKRAVIHEALELYVQMEAQKEVRKLRGKVKWIGDLPEMRRDQDYRDLQ